MEYANATFAAPDPPIESEMRHEERIVFCQQAWALPIDSPTDHHSIIINDISTVGVGFVAAHEFPAGAWLLLTFPFPNGAWRKVLCYTRHSCLLANGLFQTGAQLEAALAVEGPSDTIPAAWVEWVIDQRQKQAAPLGGPVLEPELISTCQTSEANSR